MEQRGQRTSSAHSTPDLWRKTGENPVMLLQQLSSDRIAEIIADEAMMARVKQVYADFKAYMAKPMRKDIPSVSYFSMEYGLCNCLKIYSGGLRWCLPATI